MRGRKEKLCRAPGQRRAQKNKKRAKQNDERVEINKNNCGGRGKQEAEEKNVGCRPGSGRSTMNVRLITEGNAVMFVEKKNLGSTR